MARSRAQDTKSTAKITAKDAALFTRPALAAAFAVHPITITKWERDGLPIEVRGGPGRPSFYKLSACVEWRVQREVQARAGDGDADEPLSPQLERARLDRARREQVDLAVQVRRGELVAAADVAREYADVAVKVKARLRAIPDGVADVLGAVVARGPAAVKDLLMRKIDEALRELADQASTPPEPADDDGSDAEMEADA